MGKEHLRKKGKTFSHRTLKLKQSLDLINPHDRPKDVLRLAPDSNPAEYIAAQLAILGAVPTVLSEDLALPDVSNRQDLINS